MVETVTIPVPSVLTVAPIIPPPVPTTAEKIFAWLKQSTTIQGIALLVFTIILQLSNSQPWPIIASSAAASLVLIILPGHGDLSTKFGGIVNDMATIAAAQMQQTKQVGSIAAGQAVIAQTQISQGSQVVRLTEGQAAIVKIVPVDSRVVSADNKVVLMESKGTSPLG